MKGEKMNIESMIKEVVDIRNANRVGRDCALDELITKFYSCYNDCRYGGDAKKLSDYSACLERLPEIYGNILEHVNDSNHLSQGSC